MNILQQYISKSKRNTPAIDLPHNKKGLKGIFMGVLKLSVIEEQNKQLKSKLRVVEQKENVVRISNGYCPCECFIREGEVTMCDNVASAGSWNID